MEILHVSYRAYIIARTFTHVTGERLYKYRCVISIWYVVIINARVFAVSPALYQLDYVVYVVPRTKIHVSFAVNGYQRSLLLSSSCLD
jgi:hypothetical protein